MKKSKKILLLFIGLFLLNIGIVKAETNIGITSAIVKEKSSTITVEEPVVSGSDITSNVTFNEVNDYVIFELTLKNNESDKYKIKSISDNNTNTNLEVEYDYDENYIESGSTSKVKVKLTYKNQLTNQNVSLNNLTITLSLEKEDGSSSEIVINPTTGDNILHYLVLLIIALTGLILIKVKKKIKTGALLIVIGLALVPFAAIAKEEYKVNFRFTNIEIKGTFEQYNVTINKGDGSDPIVRTITYGDPVGELPEAPEKAGHTFSKWVDGNGNEVTSETPVTGPITISPEYTTDKHTLTIVHPEYIEEGDISGEYEYGTNITLTPKTIEGKTFSKWSDDTTDNPKTITIGTTNIEIEAIYVDDTPVGPKTATFKTGSEVDNKMQELSGSKESIPMSTITSNRTINHFEKSSTAPDTSTFTEDNIISTDDSDVPIYIWWDNTSKTIYWWSEADTVYLNENSSTMFAGLSEVLSIDIHDIDASKVTNMSHMFRYDSKLVDLNVNLNNLSNVTNVAFMFSGCSSLEELDLSSFDTSNVTQMSSLFSGCSSLEELNLSSFNTNNVVYMESMFNGCSSLTELNLSSFNTSNVTNMSNMFSNSSNLETIIASDNFSTTKVTSSSSMFYGCASLVGGHGTTYNPSYLDKEYAHKDGGLNNPGYFTSNSDEYLITLNPNGGTVSVESYYINVGSSLGELLTPAWGAREFYGWFTEREDGDEVTSETVPEGNLTIYAHWEYLPPEATFMDGPSLNSIMNDLSSYSSITEFKKADSLPDNYEEMLDEYTMEIVSTDDSEVPIYMWYDEDDYTIYWWSEAEKVYLNEDSSMMFNNLSSIVKIEINSIDTSKVTNMEAMFQYCESLEEIDVTHFDTSNVEDMSSMFESCRSLKELDLSSFDTRNVTDMAYMFEYDENLTTIIVSDTFTTNNVNNYDDMFYECSSLTGSKGTKYYSDQEYNYDFIEIEYAHIDGGICDPGFFTEEGKLLITLNPNGGGVYTESILINKGSAIGTLPIPVRNGYNFIGWFTEETGGDEVTSETKPDSVLTLYAHWEESLSADLIQVSDNGDGVLSLGDFVTIGEDGFYIISIENGIVKLLTKYNIGYDSRQDSYANFMEYSNYEYWNGSAASSSSSSTSDYSFDTDSYGYEYIYRDSEDNNTPNGLYYYIDNYKSHLIEDLEVEGILDARLMSYEEAKSITCSDSDRICIKDLNGLRYEDYGDMYYWLGSLKEDGQVFIVNNGKIDSNYYSEYYGIRPLIEINEDELATHYIVTFDTDGGTEIHSQRLAVGEKVVKPSDPTKTNYIFEGWYTDGTYETEFDFDSDIDKNTVIYAKFVHKCRTFETDSWDTIVSNINSDSSYYALGCEKEVEIDINNNNKPKLYTVRLANTSTPEVCETVGYSQTACGTVIEFVDIVANKQMNSSQTNAGGWDATYMRSYLNDDFYNKLPDDLKSVIITTNPVVSGSGKIDANIDNSGISPNTEDKIYLLSAREVGYDATSDNKNSLITDTRVLDYYEGTSSTGEDSKRIKYNTSGTVKSWWVRSAYSYDTSHFLMLYTDGNVNSKYADTTNIGVAPAFRIIKNTYTLTYDATEGTVSNASKEVIKGNTIGTLPIPTAPEGKEFVGWFTDSDDGDEVTSDYVMNGNLTIYARFKYLCNGFGVDSWSTIVSNIEDDSSYYPIGCEKEVEIDMDDDNTPESYTIRLANTSTPEVCSTNGYSQTACGTVIEFVDIVANKRINSTDKNDGGWKDTELVTWLNNDFYNKLPNDLRELIIPTYPIVSGSGSESTSVNITAADTTKNKVYLLSTREVGLVCSGNRDNKNNPLTDTRTLDYYELEDSTRVKKNLAGIINSWWTRSAVASSNYFYNYADMCGSGDFPNKEHYIAPAFRIGTN